MYLRKNLTCETVPYKYTKESRKKNKIYIKLVEPKIYLAEFYKFTYINVRRAV